MVIAMYCSWKDLSSSPPQNSIENTPSHVVVDGWKPFSIGLLNESMDTGKAVFINFTATWCITCQVNKKTTFTKPAVKDFAEKNNIVLLEADWTHREKNSEVTKLLHEYGRPGVPLYVYYPNRSSKEEFFFLPEVLTPKLFMNTINKIHTQTTSSP